MGQWLESKRVSLAWREDLSGREQGLPQDTEVSAHRQRDSWGREGLTDDWTLPSAADTSKQAPGIKNKCLARNEGPPATSRPAGLYI